MSEIIELTDTTRLRIEHDLDAECPRGDWHMLTGFVKIPGRGDSRLNDVPAVHDDPTSGIAWAHDQLVPGFGIRDDHRDETLVERWARAFYGLHIEYDAEHGGYWFVAGADAATYAAPIDTYSRALFRDNWPDLEPGSPESIAKQAEVIEQERETYRQWAEGEVYGVILERAVAYARVERNTSGDVWDLKNPLTEDDVREDWEEVDSTWGCYLDDDYTAEVVAQAHFDLNKQEREALGIKEER